MVNKGWLLGVLWVLASQAFAEFEPYWSTDKKWVLVGRLNPDALMVQGSWDRQYAYSYHPELSMVDGYLQYGAITRLSPASFSIGGNLEWLPLPILQLKAESEVIRYFGNFSNVLTFDAVTDDYSDEARDQLEDEAQSSTVFHHKVDAILRAKIGSIIGRYVYTSEWFDFDVEGTLIYEPGYDLLMENAAQIDTQKLEVFYQFPSLESEKKLLGVFHETNESLSVNMKNTKIGMQSLWSDQVYGEQIKWLWQFGQHLTSKYREDEFFVTVGIIKGF